MANGLAEVKHLVNVNLGRPVSNPDWQACVDADRLANRMEAGNDCISWETADDQLIFRVRVPDQVTDTTFGKILGVNTLTTSAFAEATLEVNPGGKILPFGLFSGNGTGTEPCLKDTSGPALPPPCDGPTLGQFGPFDVAKYAPGTGFCQSTNNVFIYSVALGIDHPMSSYEPDYVLGNPEAREGCSAGVPTPVPNTVRGGTGNKVPLLNKGLLEGDSVLGLTFPGRLASPGSGATIDTGTAVQINNQPIWTWFRPGYCGAAGSGTPAARKLAALSCLSTWSFATDGAIFVAGFDNAQRLAFVPLYSEGAPLPGGYYHINKFLPVYLESVYIQNGGGFLVAQSRRRHTVDHQRQQHEGVDVDRVELCNVN